MIIGLLVVIGLIVVVAAISVKKPPRAVPVAVKPPVVETAPAVAEKQPEPPPPPVVEPQPPPEPVKGKGKQRGKVARGQKQPVAATPPTPPPPQPTGGTDANIIPVKAFDVIDPLTGAAVIPAGGNIIFGFPNGYHVAR